MATFTLTYQQSRDHKTILDLLDSRRGEAILDAEMFQKCCGSIAYLSLFLLPGFELADKGVYSIERICQYVPGFFKYDMHTLLTKLGEIACGNMSAENLHEILNLTTFYECFEFLKLKPAIWYKIFLHQYIVLKKLSISWDTVNSCSTFDEVVQLFNRETLL